MVYSAAQLIRAHGVSGTSLRDVVAHARAPRGSLAHYFPGGKEQLVAEAVAWTRRYVGRQVSRFVAALDPPVPSGLFRAMAGQWRDEFTSAGFGRGCPLVAITAGEADNDSVREAVRDAFDGWQRPVAAALTDLGVPAERAEPLALLMISALEGAIVLARVRRDVEPLDTVVAELAPLLDAAVVT